MTWHQWHHTAPISRRMGLSSALARAKAASFHSCQSIGWCAAERRYGLAESFRRFSGWSVKVAHSLRLRRRAVEVLRFAQDDTRIKKRRSSRKGRNAKNVKDRTLKKHRSKDRSQQKSI